MLAIYLSPIYILLNLYIMRWLIWWDECLAADILRKKWVRAAVIVIYAFFALSLLTGFCCRSERRSAS